MEETLAIVALIGTTAAVARAYAMGDPNKQRPFLRSLSAVIEENAPGMQLIFVVLQAIVFALLGKGTRMLDQESTLNPLVATMMCSGLGATLYTLEKHYRAHFAFITTYVLAVCVLMTSLSASLPDLPIRMLALALNVFAAYFVIMLGIDWGIERVVWSTTLTVIELVWFALLFAFLGTLSVFMGDFAQLY